MFSSKEYKNLAREYGSYSSWAIWDYEDESNVKIIEENVKDLNSKYVLIGLNISGSLKNIPWINFHSGKHDRKLKYACNDTILRGSYITDLFKDFPEVNSMKLEKTTTGEQINKDIKFFIKEMKDVKVSDGTVFIIFGTAAKRYYKKYFEKYFSNEVMYYKHYSSRGTDRDWVEGCWKLTNISSDFDATLYKYRPTT